MFRKCKKLEITSFLADINEHKNKNVEIFIDEGSYNEILDFLLEKDENGKPIRIDRFRRILYEVISFRYNKDLYDKPKISKKSEDVTVMKFKRHRGMNYRILCKEFFFSGKKVVMIILFNKTSDKIDKRQRSQMDSIGGYQYEF